MSLLNSIPEIVLCLLTKFPGLFCFNFVFRLTSDSKKVSYLEVGLLLHLDLIILSFSLLVSFFLIQSIQFSSIRPLSYAVFEVILELSYFQ